VLVAKKDRRTILRQLAQTLQAAARDGMKSAAGQPSKVEEQQRIEDGVFIGRDHMITLGRLFKIA